MGQYPGSDPKFGYLEDGVKVQAQVTRLELSNPLSGDAFDARPPLRRAHADHGPCLDVPWMDLYRLSLATEDGGEVHQFFLHRPGRRTRAGWPGRK